MAWVVLQSSRHRERSPKALRSPGSPLPGARTPAPALPRCAGEGTPTFQQGSSLASTGKKGGEHVSGRWRGTSQDWRPRGRCGRGSHPGHGGSQGLCPGHGQDPPWDGGAITPGTSQSGSFSTVVGFFLSMTHSPSSKRCQTAHFQITKFLLAAGSELSAGDTVQREAQLPVYRTLGRLPPALTSSPCVIVPAQSPGSESGQTAAGSAGPPPPPPRRCRGEGGHGVEGPGAGMRHPPENKSVPTAHRPGSPTHAQSRGPPMPTPQGSPGRGAMACRHLPLAVRNRGVLR